MLFPSVAFALFFGVFLVVWWSLPPGKSNRVSVLLVANSVFYAWSAWSWLPVLWGVWMVVAVAVAALNSTPSSTHRRWVGGAAVLLLLAHLVFWKYTPWLIDVWDQVAPERALPLPEWVQPLGLSFFTFHALAVILRTAACGCRYSPCLAAAQVGFFPTLLAGPVLRTGAWLERWSRPWLPGTVPWLEGMGRILMGLTFKWVLATHWGDVADPVFRGLQTDPTAVWVGVHAYALQIFFDFAGYSHMALGVALLLGWRLPENFTRPYASASLMIFWRRWHRSLSFFFRDWVYIRMLGGRRGRLPTAANVVLTMLISGLWHGAGGTFLLWGAWHGLGVVIAGVGRRWWRPPTWLGWVLTFQAVVWGWVWFRSPDLASAVAVFRHAWLPDTDWALPSLSLLLWGGGSVALLAAERRLLAVFRNEGRREVLKGCGWLSSAGWAAVWAVWAWVLWKAGPEGVPAFIYSGF